MTPYGVIVIAYSETLLDFSAYLSPLQAESHICRPLKKADIFHPANTALAMLKPAKLLFHLPAAIRANFIGFSYMVFRPPH